MYSNNVPEWNIKTIHAAPPCWQLVFVQPDGRHTAKPLYYVGFGIERVFLQKTRVMWDIIPLDYDPDGHYWDIALLFPGYCGLLLPGETLAVFASNERCYRAHDVAALPQEVPHAHPRD